LRLYIAGDAPNSVRAIANTKALCDDHFRDGYQLEIVDLLTHPLRALTDGVIVTPTLLRLCPLPVHRVIGNLSDTSRVLLALADP
jgi:circadian clock protein KaiB